MALFQGLLLRVKSKETFKHWWLTFWLLTFCLSRIVVLTHPPYTQEGGGYSDVKQDYERYANMWRYGLTPYYEHLYEYPPATIPLVYLPLEIDQLGVGFYYLNYRVEIFLFELVLFLAIAYTLLFTCSQFKLSWLGLSFYILAGMIAKDYWYEGIDLVFAGMLTLSFLWRLKWGHSRMMAKLGFWTLFWLSTSIKFLTLPLLIPLALNRLHDWRKELVAIMLGFVLVWGFPLAYFRSSIAVMFVVHLQRPLKYGSFGTFVIKAINDYTKTEVQTDIKPHFPIVGPVSTVVERSVAIVYPLAMLLWLGGSVLMLYKRQWRFATKEQTFVYFIGISLTYMYTTFLAAKIFSSPFHLWYIPLLSLFPYKSKKLALISMSLAIFMLLLDTTTWIPQSNTLIFGSTPLVRLRDGLRFGLMGTSLVWWIFLTRNWLKNLEESPLFQRS